MHKFKTLIVIFLIALSLSFSACEKEPKVEDTAVSDQEFANLEDIGVAEQPSGEEGAEPENNNAATDVVPEEQEKDAQINSSNEEVEEVQRTFAARETGSDPNPNSDFAKLADEEKEALVNWLSQVSESYQSIGTSFNNFISTNVNSDKLKSEQNIGDLDAFQDLKNEVLSALSEIDQAASNLNAESALPLKEKAAAMNKWYEDFLLKLENMNLGNQDLQAELDSNLDEAMSTMQGFLDALYSFSN